MNKVILMGRLTNEPDVRQSQGANPMTIARFTLAVDKRTKDNQTSANFINCVAFGKTAEVVQNYTHKGTKLLLEGTWETGSFTNKDGNKVYTNEMAVTNLEFCESNKSNGNSNSNSNNGNNSTPKAKADDDFMKVNNNANADDGFPFN